MIDKIAGRVSAYPRILSAHGFKRFTNQVLNDLEAFLKRPRLRSSPRIVDLAITDNCNLACIMCPRTNNQDIELSELDINKVKSIIDKVSSHATTIQLAGGLGEPLLHKNIFEAIRYCKEKGLETQLTSNGTLLDDKNIGELLDCGLNYISFSIDAATRETYESIRVNASFERVIDGVKKLCEERDKKKSGLRIEIVPVIMVGKNLHEVPAMVRLVSEVGADGIIFGDVGYTVEGKSSDTYAVRNTEDKNRINTIFDEAKRLGEELGVKVGLPRLEPTGERINCYQPWTMLTITTKGEVRPCCGVHDIFMGNILKQPLEEIWSSQGFIRWREKMNSDNPPEPCRKCPMGF